MYLCGLFSLVTSKYYSSSKVFDIGNFCHGPAHLEHAGIIPVQVSRGIAVNANIDCTIKPGDPELLEFVIAKDAFYWK